VAALAALAGVEAGERRDRHARLWKERRVGDGVADLVGAVEAIDIQSVVQVEAIVENAVTGAKHGFGSPQAALRRSNAPGEADTRRPIAVIGDVVLHFIAQAEAQRDVGLHAPIVLNERAGVELRAVDQRISGGELKLIGGAAFRRDLRKRQSGGDSLLHDLVGGDVQEIELAAEVIGLIVGDARFAKANAELDEVHAVRDGSVILQLVVVLVDEIVDHGAAAGEGVGHRDIQNRVVAQRVVAIVIELKARLVDGGGVHHLGFDQVHALIGGRGGLRAAAAGDAGHRHARRQTGAADALIGAAGLIERITPVERDIGRQLIGEARAQSIAGVGRDHREALLHRQQRNWIENHGV